MKITDILKKETIIMDLKATDKEKVIEEMIENLNEFGVLNDKKEFKREILKREEHTSTGLGDGVALPHAKTESVNKPAILLARSDKGIDFESLDGKPTHIFFMLAATEDSDDEHIKTLSSISKLILSDGFIDKLKNAETKEEIIEIIETSEEEIMEDDKVGKVEDDDKPYILAVTSCPTGIAHTYMAADALNNMADEMDVNIKVETNGSDGVKNKLTNSDIKEAKGVIVAADTKINLDRFSGKPVVRVKVSEGIRKPKELIEKILNDEASIYKGDSTESEKEINEKVKEDGSFFSNIYQDIMSGVSHMLPFVVGGGILMALSFMVERFFGDNSFIFKLLNGAGNGAFNFLIPILSGFIAMSIGDRPALMPGMVAGVIASEGAGFLGGIIGGFIAGYIIIFVRNITKNLPSSLDGVRTMLLYPVLGLFITAGLMYIFIDPIFTSINLWIARTLSNLGTMNVVLLGALLGGMMAVDMGGPVNKAAYAFSIGIFTDTGDGAFMAAVMAGGMVPPLAIAIATTIFKDKFTEAERQAGLTNYVLGLSFITEGAIPFAASDPVRLIGSSIVGAAISGGLTQYWNIKSPAPHGGIFIIPAMEDITMGLKFLAAVLIGAIISAIIYGVLKEKEEAVTI